MWSNTYRKGQNLIIWSDINIAESSPSRMLEFERYSENGQSRNELNKINNLCSNPSTTRIQCFCLPSTTRDLNPLPCMKPVNPAYPLYSSLIPRFKNITRKSQTDLYHHLLSFDTRLQCIVQL